MAEPRVQIFMDYQNVHLSVAEAFAPPGTPPSTTTLHPGLFGDAVMNARLRSQRTGVLTAVHVFRGQASSDREPTLASITKAQAANWRRDSRVTMHTRPLRYPTDGQTCQHAKKVWTSCWPSTSCAQQSRNRPTF
jgi:hypothetical protein